MRGIPCPRLLFFLMPLKQGIGRRIAFFCERADHEGTECGFAENLTLEDKLGKLRKKGVCFRCLKYGHLRKLHQLWGIETFKDYVPQEEPECGDRYTSPRDHER
ncbi:hypothetical protein LAZ67_12001538 [Cordylochernes scorpioides]|uniref:Uncharacterized protein n=1 Tax=Cordylochernes scorpioides TaxID=51811 RepID=A0ABY6L183_9ARAC|nr:hypothetical protein LAZ67_12001538 [Cordylochernes scorpioides]